MIRVENVAKRSAVAMQTPWRLGSEQPAQRLVRAVEDVSSTAANGRKLGLLGPNGVDKITTLRMLSAIFPPDAGRLSVNDIDVVANPRDALARMGILGDARGIYPRLSARENIVYYGSLHGMSRDAAKARADTLARALEMTHLLDRRTEGFSQGERMKTALARAPVHGPANLVRDETTNDLDILATRALRQALRHLRTPEGGSKCIVFSSPIMSEVERLCDSVDLVSGRRTVAQGTVEAWLAQSGETDFEEVIVKLAFGAKPSTTEGAIA